MSFGCRHARTRWRHTLPSRIALAATVAASGCSLGERTGDGLVGDGRQIHLEPTEATNPPLDSILDSGGADGGAGDPNATECVALSLFTEKVVPRFEKYCVECHGVKEKTAERTALVKLAIFPEPGTSCTATLDSEHNEVVNKEAVLESTVLTSSDPNSDLQHDFKFEEEGMKAYDDYEAALLEWINAEAQGG